MIELTFFANDTRFGFGAHWLRDDKQNIVIDEIPEDIQSALEQVVRYFACYKTDAEKAQIEALKQMKLSDDDLLKYQAIIPKFNQYETYRDGDIALYNGHLFRYKAPMLKAMYSTDPTNHTVNPKQVAPIVNPGEWSVIGDDLPIYNWTRETVLGQGYMEGDRVKFDDGRVMLSKINYNTYHPDDMPEVWLEVSV